MPGGDGTGPMGLGPRTGRAAGFCAGYPMPGSLNPIFGRGAVGWVGGFGRGRGWRNWYYATGLPRWARGGAWPYAVQFGAAWPYAAPSTGATASEREAGDLRAEAEYLRGALESLEKRLAELESQAAGK